MQSRSLRIFYKLEKKLLKVLKLFSREKFDKQFYKHLKKIGVNLEVNPRFISDDVYLDEVDYSLINIEKNVTISKGVTLLVHDFSITQPLIIKGEDIQGAVLLRPIYLKKGCFIGANSIILPGTCIGENVIVGAGSVVKGDIPDNVIIAGNPARVINTIENYGEKILNVPAERIKIWR
ncbi:acyltransferase [Priestia megaterium]|uniref:acyltransferase n=1 Tax=Priestia megaterium TaxID=1404 RepID=UPI00366F8926